MRKFLEDMGVLARKDHFPDGPEERLVKAFEDHGVGGPDRRAPRVCLTQTFKGKWNKEVVEILTASFISVVKEGRYRHVQHTWEQMEEGEVRKRCQRKLYRTQRLCRTRRNLPRRESDKINRMHQRRQEVCLLLGTLHQFANVS